jgi:hypothetical protein
MHADRLKLEWLPGRYAICRLDADSALPEWVASNLRAGPSSAPRTNSSVNLEPSLLSITRTDGELSIVIDEELVPQKLDTRIERRFVAMRIAGTVDFSAVGILSTLTSALAAARVAVFAISTFDTDVLLVKAADADRACRALQSVADLALPRS